MAAVKVYVPEKENASEDECSENVGVEGETFYRGKWPTDEPPLRSPQLQVIYVVPVIDRQYTFLPRQFAGVLADQLLMFPDFYLLVS
ncbi:hypothetical protein HAX54_027563 [Datura stramonium]|uniref:Uncharacterized protein n=1 Tax=Datura stramonium TaxID=4076 RepID=A0ABS8S8W9_DATST|nr:hypothetical protein [Datura stramonium]